MIPHYPVIIIGGGQAGLSISYLLKQRDIDHLVLEKSTIADSWQNKRWESFCLVTPNWQCLLPGFHYSGKDPAGFMVRDQIVEYIRDYAKSFSPPILEGVTVHKLFHSPRGRGLRPRNVKRPDDSRPGRRRSRRVSRPQYPRLRQATSL